MPKLGFQGSEHSGFYRSELGIALQNELRALADIECIYEQQRDGLERSALPPSIKEHLANQLEERRASSRSSHEQRVAQLPRRDPPADSLWRPDRALSEGAICGPSQPP